jgi:hypothetical protein
VKFPRATYRLDCFSLMGYDGNHAGNRHPAHKKDKCDHKNYGCLKYRIYKAIKLCLSYPDQWLLRMAFFNLF